MNHLLTLSPLPTSTAHCQQTHLLLKGVIREQEEEISQLRSLLADVMDQHNCRSLHHDAVDYDHDLDHLQTKLNRLHRDVLCEGTHCPPVQARATCSDVRFGLSASLDQHTTALIGEFTRIKDGCLQFLGGMMSLNLL